MDDENIFDDDDVIDYLLLEECKNEENQSTNRQTGCLSIVLVILIPLGGVPYLFILL